MRDVHETGTQGSIAAAAHTCNRARRKALESQARALAIRAFFFFKWACGAAS